MTIAVYPGTFDPLTRGHQDIVRRASDLFEKNNLVLRKVLTKILFYSRGTSVNRRGGFDKESTSNSPWFH